MCIFRDADVFAIDTSSEAILLMIVHLLPETGETRPRRTSGSNDYGAPQKSIRQIF
jgi:hypothetical protein